MDFRDQRDIFEDESQDGCRRFFQLCCACILPFDCENLLLSLHTVIRIQYIQLYKSRDENRRRDFGQSVPHF